MMGNFHAAFSVSENCLQSFSALRNFSELCSELTDNNVALRTGEALPDCRDVCRGCVGVHSLFDSFKHEK